MDRKRALAAVRRAYGKKAVITESKKALNPLARGRVLARLSQLNQQQKESQLSSSAIEVTWRGLIQAARFAVDVNGDDPSLPQLQKALAESEKLRDLIGERMDRANEIKNLRNLWPWAKRFRVLRPSGICSVIEVEADTLAELVESISRKRGALVSASNP